MLGSEADTRGFTLLELLFAATLIVLLMTMSAAVVARELDEYRTVGAVRYLATRLQRARMDAVSRGANAALRFTAAGAGYMYAVYGDGNGDGVRSADIDHGVDPQLLPGERLSDQFPGVDFGTLPALPAVDASGTPPGSDPVRLGSARMASFTPVGTSSSGSLYILGPHEAQFVIRLYRRDGKEPDPPVQRAAASMGTVMNERRSSARVATAGKHGIVSARVRAGAEIAVIDASPVAVLVEGRQRLLPNSSVDLQLSTDSLQVTLRGRVVRSMVSRLGANGVWYRGAIRFDRHLPWMADGSSAEAALPGAELRPAARERGPATHVLSGL